MGHVFGPSVKPVCASTGLKGEIAVASAAVVYTHSMNISFGKNFALKYKASAETGTADVKIEIEESDRLPTTEGSSDTQWVTPEGVPEVETTLTDEVWHIKTLSLVVAPYLRFKITGNAANVAGTVVEMYLLMQSEG